MSFSGAIFPHKILMANEPLRWFALILVSKIRLYLTESESNGRGAGKIQIDVGGLENVSTFVKT